MDLRRPSLLAAMLAVAGAGVLFLLRPAEIREAEDPSMPAPTVADNIAPAHGEPTPTAPGAERTAEQIAAAENLQAMSETFRHTTLLIAIRNAGYVCDDVVDVFQSAVDAVAWRARCRDLRAYHIGIEAGGALVVEPTADLWDGIYPPSRIEGGRRQLLPEIPFNPRR